jgi:hypothetical protein
VHHSIDEFVDVRRTAHFLSAIKESEKYQTMPVYSTWMMKTLSSGFKFNLGQLARAQKELYSNQMAIVCNVKPIMGEYEFKIEKRPKPLLYLKLSID